MITSRLLSCIIGPLNAKLPCSSATVFVRFSSSSLTHRFSQATSNVDQNVSEKPKYYFYNTLRLLEQNLLELHISEINGKQTPTDLWKHINENKLTLNILKALHEAIIHVDSQNPSRTNFSANKGQHMLLIEPYAFKTSLTTGFNGERKITTRPDYFDQLVYDGNKLVLRFKKIDEKSEVKDSNNSLVVDLRPVDKKDYRKMLWKLKLEPIVVEKSTETDARIHEKDLLWKEIFHIYNETEKEQNQLSEVFNVLKQKPSLDITEKTKIEFDDFLAVNLKEKLEEYPLEAAETIEKLVNQI